MTFLKVDRKASGTYISTVESVRVGKKVQHISKYPMGKLEDYKTESLIGIAEKLLSLAAEKNNNPAQQSLFEEKSVDVKQSEMQE